MLNYDTRCRPLLAMLFPGPSKGWVGGPWGGGCGFLSGFARGFVGALGRVWGVPMVLVGAGRSFMSVLACALLVWGVSAYM